MQGETGYLQSGWPAILAQMIAKPEGRGVRVFMNVAGDGTRKCVRQKQHSQLKRLELAIKQEYSKRVSSVLFVFCCAPISAGAEPP